MSIGAADRPTVVLRAGELFTFEERGTSSPLVMSTWATRSEPAEAFLSGATTNWELVVTRQRGRAWLTVRGPETHATAAGIPTEAEFLGIPFTLGTSLAGVDMRQLVDRSWDLPAASDSSCWFAGRTWALPGPDDVDRFVGDLERHGLLVHDPIVAAAVAGDAGVDGLSRRTVERRVLRATGLTRGAIRQVRRAERAVELLADGMPTVDVVRVAGYSDQPHLTRSLRRFVGQTPSRIAHGA
jgi:AraC-like DNA-binding protein